MRRILITGASGFIGANLVHTLANQALVFGVARRQSSTVSIVWDFEEVFPRKAFPDQVDVIIHAGALLEGNSHSARSYEVANILSSIKLADFASTAGVSHFIYLSTGGIYGQKQGWLTETMSPAPHGLYANSKLLGEIELQKLIKNMSLTILRLFFPYGSGQKGRLIPNLTNKIRSGLRIRLNNAHGSPRINPIFIDDLVAIIKGIIEHNVSGVINVAGPELVSIRNLTEMIGNHLNKPAVYEVGDSDDYDFLGDITKLRSVVPNLQLTGLHDGLASVFGKVDYGLG